MPKTSDSSPTREAVQRALAEAGESANWLARESGVQQPTLSKWLSGNTRGLGSDLLDKILPVLGLEISTATRPKAGKKK